MIATADWTIDLSFENDGGDAIVAASTQEDIVKVKRNYTGQFLAPVLARSRRDGKKRIEAAE